MGQLMRQMLTLMANLLSTKFWTSNGNSSSNPDSQFIGTIDSNAFVFRTNNLERIRVEATGIIAMKAGVRINNFAGHGMQIVYADASGNLRLGDPITHDPNGVPNTLYNCSGDGLSITEVPWKRETIGKVFLCGEKVGINNPNPSEDLDVIGTIKASTLGSTGSGSLSTSGIVIANGDGKLDKLPNGTTNQVLSISGWINPQNLGQWSVGTNPNNIYYSGGSVGIGTNSPLQTLDVNGRIRVNYGVIQKGTTSTISAITTTADLGLYSLNAGDYMRFVTNGSPFRFFTDPDLGTAPSGNGSVFTIESNGNVGIGTSSAASKLHIKGTGSTDAVLLIEPGQWSAVGDYGEIRFGNSSHFIRGEYSRGITIYDANQISLMGGNVGIGTTPNYKLDVSGTVNALGYLLNGLPLSTSQWQDNSSNIYFDNGGGNVSIGTTDATYKLNVCGAIHSTEVKVDASGWCDFVFENDYLRMSFQEQINYFKQNKHLIGMPSAKEVESKGLEVSTAMKGLTLNMEETKLDILDLYKMIVEIKKENSQLKEENQLLEKKIISIQSKR